MPAQFGPIESDGTGHAIAAYARGRESGCRRSRRSSGTPCGDTSVSPDWTVEAKVEKALKTSERLVEATKLPYAEFRRSGRGTHLLTLGDASPAATTAFSPSHSRGDRN
jgi:hypothetical protein